MGCVDGWPVGCDDGGPPTATWGKVDAVAPGYTVCAPRPRNTPCTCERKVEMERARTGYKREEKHEKCHIKLSRKRIT